MEIRATRLQTLDNRPGRAHGAQAAARGLAIHAGLDLFERALVIVLFAYFVRRMLSPLARMVAADLADPHLLIDAAAANLGALLLVVSEILALALILARRRTAELSTSPIDWALSLGAVCAPLLTRVAAPASGLAYDAGTGVMLAGMTVQVAAKAAMWRSFGIAPANRGVRTGGPYRVIRHPMYAGYALAHVGFVLAYPSPANALLYAGAFFIQIARLLREERLLNRDPRYRRYAARVPYRLVPTLF